MKWKNLKISWQLNISLIIIFICVIFLGINSFVNSNNLWINTDGMYQHPFIVQQAIGALNSDLLRLRLATKVLVMEHKYINKKYEGDILMNLKIDDADTIRQIDTLYQRYLGPKGDIDMLNQAVINWKTLRDETIRLYASGNILEAESRVIDNGYNYSQFNEALISTAKILDFAKNKAELFYTDAAASKNSNLFELEVAFAIILLIMLLISILLSRKIVRSIKAHLLATEELQKGKMDIRIQEGSNDELGLLAKSFNKMVTTLQSEILRKEAKMKVSNVMISYDDLQLFCQALLENLIDETNSQIGALYLLNENTNVFENYASIGIDKKFIKIYSTLQAEVEFSMAISTMKVQHITDIPSDGQVIYHAISGDFKAKEILTIPVLKDKKVSMIISLASIKKYSDDSIWLVNNLLNELSARFNSIFASLKVQEFSEKIQQANFKLQQQSKELEMQANELVEQNMELEVQSTQLREATLIKSTFLSNMSHELRTPLNSVIALASVLNRRLKGTIPEEEYSYIDVIERNGKHLLTLVNDILDLSKIESGKEELNITRFSINDLVNEIIEMLDPIVRKKGLKIINNISQIELYLSSDKKKCRHIFQNIIGNAVKFTEEGIIEIFSSLDDGYINVIIKDNGIGIDSHHIELIFDEFKQVDDSLSRKNVGTGLGLAIAQKYALLLGGNISVESELGVGSIFNVKLPCEMSYSNIKTYEKCGQNKQILLVENSEPAIIQITDILNEEGYKVDLAHNGKEAIVCLDVQKPDGIILDLMMPEMDGFELLKTIRNNERFSKLPVLILTAKHVTKEELSFLKNNHVYQLIQKGDIDKKHLLLSIERMVNSNTTD